MEGCEIWAFTENEAQKSRKLNKANWQGLIVDKS